MSRRSRSALKSATGLALVLTTLAAQDALANDEPFPLDLADLPQPTPSGFGDPAALSAAPRGDYQFIMEAVVNGEPRPRMVKLRDAGGRIQLDRSSAEYLGLKLPRTGGQYIDIAAFEGVSAQIDWTRHVLNLSVSYARNAANVVDYAARSSRDGQGVTTVTALALSYDLTARTTPKGGKLSGLVTARAVHGEVALDSSFTFGAGSTSRAVRLDTVLTVNMPGQLTSLQIGDFVQTAPAEARAIRMGGVQIGSNFALQPDLITYPLPDFAGSLAVPQTVDLLVNDRRLRSENLQAGEFSLRNVPVSSGRGRIGAVVKDALGRERYQTLDFYASRDLLSPGTRQWALSLGAIRRRYGVASADYGDMVASLVLRRPFGPRLTIGVAGEAGAGLINAGADAVTVIGSLAQLSLGARTSRLERDGAAVQRGHALSFSLQSSGPNVSFRLSGRKASKAYHDLASASGDRQPGSFLALATDFNLADLGGVSLTAVRERDSPGLDPRSPFLPIAKGSVRSVATAAYRRNVGRANLFVEASGRREAGRTSFGVLAGISVIFGGRTIASSSLSAGHDAGTSASFALERPAIDPGDVGAYARIDTGQFDRVRGGMAYQGDWGRIEAEAELVGNRAASRLSARGGLVLADGALYPVRSIDGAMLLVDTNNVQGIDVTRENRVQTRSGKRRKILLSDLIPRVVNRIGIVPETLPANAVSRSLASEVVIPGGSVARLDLGIQAFEPRLVRITDHHGQAFAPGTPARALPSGQMLIIGLDGDVEINMAARDKRLAIDLPDGSSCMADLADVQQNDARFLLRCYGIIRPFPADRIARSTP